MSDKKITLAILDDHPIVVEGLKSLFNSKNSLFDIHTFGNIAAFNSFFENHSIDVILLDINLPDGSGIDLCKTIKMQAPMVKVIGLSNQIEQSIIRQMFDNGASGFLLKTTQPDKIISGVEDVLHDQIVMSEEVMRIFTTTVQPKNFPSLTKREKQLIQLLAQGKTTAMIAEEIFLSKFTIDTYRKNLLQKFKVKNTSELLMLVVQENLI